MPPPRRPSAQKRLEKIRSPRVQISYDVEVGDAIETKELPFVVGVVGDFTGQPDPDTPLPKLKERKFVNIDRENFDEVMQAMAPQARYRVKNVLDGQGGEFGVSLSFKSLDDFSPEAVAQQIDPLNELLALRRRLADLRNRIVSSDKFGEVLSQVLQNTEKLKQLGQEIRQTED